MMKWCVAKHEIARPLSCTSAAQAVARFAYDIGWPYTGIFPMFNALMYKWESLHILAIRLCPCQNTLSGCRNWFPAVSFDHQMIPAGKGPVAKYQLILHELADFHCEGSFYTWHSRRRWRYESKTNGALTLASSRDPLSSNWKTFLKGQLAAIQLRLPPSAFCHSSAEQPLQQEYKEIPLNTMK